VHSHSSTEQGREFATELGGHYLQADLSDDAEAADLIEDCAATWGRLDVSVNNAGISKVIAHNDLAAATPAIRRGLLEVNLIAPLGLDHRRRPAPPGQRGRGRPASILNITSHTGVRPKGASIPYAASKAALVHVTKLLAAALGPDNRVNAIAPGLVDTTLSAGWTAVQDLWREKAPMSRAAQPADVADLASSLIHNSCIAGEVIVLEGMNLR
jgi:NAD(P)-dependent dehydrogenase (short-subunit alcohol dehydrogenase family)